MIISWFSHCRDADTPANSRVRFSLLSNDDDDDDALRTFELEPETGEIVLRAPLDRETREEYSLEVGATDGAWKLDTTVAIFVQVRMTVQHQDRLQYVEVN